MAHTEAIDEGTDGDLETDTPVPGFRDINKKWAPAPRVVATYSVQVKAACLHDSYVRSFGLPYIRLRESAIASEVRTGVMWCPSRASSRPHSSIH